MNILLIALLFTLSRVPLNQALIPNPDELADRKAYAAVIGRRIEAFSVTGSNSVTVDDVYEEDRIQIGDPFDTRRLRSFSLVLRHVLADRGFVKAHVSKPMVTITDTGVRVELRVSEGVRYVIGAIIIENNAAFTADEIRTALGFQIGPCLTANAVRNGLAALYALYWSHGYVNFHFELRQVLHEVAAGKSEGTMDLRLLIEEGDRYVMGGIVFVGKSELDSQALAAGVNPHKGEPFDEGKLMKSLVGLKRAFGADAEDHPDYKVTLDEVTKEASVTVLGFKRYEP